MNSGNEFRDIKRKEFTWLKFSKSEQFKWSIKNRKKYGTLVKQSIRGEISSEFWAGVPVNCIHLGFRAVVILVMQFCLAKKDFA